MIKKILYISPIIASLGFFGSYQTAFAEQSCHIQSGPIKELSDYQISIQKELQEIANKAQNSCEGKTKNQASLIFDSAYAELQAFDGITTDFNYNLQVAFKGDTSNTITRDAQIFGQIEKQISQTTEQLANQCGLNDENKIQLRNMIIEVQSLKRVYQKTTIGKAQSEFTGIRPQNIITAKSITQAYHPSQTAACVNKDETQKGFFESLKNIINIGGRTENALESWRKALSLIRGEGMGMTPSEYALKQRQLLLSELSRQGFSQNSKNVILQNFDCFKSKMTTNDGENALNARIQCLSFPVTGVENLFLDWKKFTWSAPNTDELDKRNTVMNHRKARAFNVIEMHQQLVELTQNDQDDNATIIQNLTQWHVSLQMTNNLLENRISPMQNNCMKGQPDIVGGCR